jgi:hypothetical protein
VTLMLPAVAPNLKSIAVEPRDKRVKRKHGPNANYGQAKKA